MSVDVQTQHITMMIRSVAALALLAGVDADYTKVTWDTPTVEPSKNTKGQPVISGGMPVRRDAHHNAGWHAAPPSGGLSLGGPAASVRSIRSTPPTI
jgi:hypothetical protein